MARVRTWHEVQAGAVRALLTSPSRGVARDMFRRGQRVRSRAIELVGADTGRLRASIFVDVVPRGAGVTVIIGSNVAYAMFHHEGHGPIRPVRAAVLAFRVRGRWVFTRYVRPVEGTEFLRKALPATRG